MSDPRKLYWDSSCFICFLNSEEARRSHICDDILKHASIGDVEIWISMWVIVEVIRPKISVAAPLPEWANKAIKAVPEANQQLNELWNRYQRKKSVTKLSTQEIEQIQGMFEWTFIKKVQIDELIASKAVELSRDYGLSPGDSIHAATAILRKCDAIQRWDKDYSKVSHLIPSEEPQMISKQGSFEIGNRFGPSPGDFQNAKKADASGKEGAISSSTEIQGSGSGHTKSQAPSKEKK